MGFVVQFHVYLGNQTGPKVNPQKQVRGRQLNTHNMSFQIHGIRDHQSNPEDTIFSITTKSEVTHKSTKQSPQKGEFNNRQIEAKIDL